MTLCEDVQIDNNVVVAAGTKVKAVESLGDLTQCETVEHGIFYTSWFNLDYVVA